MDCADHDPERRTLEGTGMSLTCPHCHNEIAKIAHVRYCAVCKGAGRVPDADLGDDWPIPDALAALFHEERKPELNPATNEMPHYEDEDQSKSQMKRIEAQKKTTLRKDVRTAKAKAKVRAKAKDKPKKKRK